MHTTICYILYCKQKLGRCCVWQFYRVSRKTNTVNISPCKSSFGIGHLIKLQIYISYMWSNRPGWKVVSETWCFLQRKKREQGCHLSLPLCGSFHDVWHDCCTVHITWPFWICVLMWRTAIISNCSNVNLLHVTHWIPWALFSGKYHWTSAKPPQLH